MKKNFLLLFTLLLLALVGTGCGDKVSGSLGKDGAELVSKENFSDLAERLPERKVLFCAISLRVNVPSLSIEKLR